MAARATLRRPRASRVALTWATGAKGMANTYGTQRAFVSANKARDDKFSWGLFEIELPIVVPDECWNMGLITTLHNWCRNIVGQPQDQPAKVTWRITSGATTSCPGGRATPARCSGCPCSRRRPVTVPCGNQPVRRRRDVSISTQATTTGSTAAARASSSRPSRRRPADSRPTTT